jgi:hypothetical protein
MPPPIMSKPSKAAHMAIVFVTVGALLMVWSGVWYAWMANHKPPESDAPHSDAPMYICYGIFLSGLTLFIIGFALGRIGRAGRRAELPPEVSTTSTAQPAVSSQPVQSAAAGQAAIPGQPVIPGQPATAVQNGAPVAGVAPTARVR